MTLSDFFEIIDEEEFKPEVYIVRLEYKYCHEDKTKRSNEILQFDPGYVGITPDAKYPWYHECWLWYSDWYMCVEPESVRVLRWYTIDELIPEYTCSACKYASIHCTIYGEDVAASDGCSDWEGDE